MDPVDVDAILDRVREALAAEDWSQAVALVEALRPPDQAELFSDLPPVEQDQLLPRLDREDSADILEELAAAAAAEIAARLETEELAQILDEMEPDEAAGLLGDIAPERVDQVLAIMDEPEEVRPLLVHADDSAGGLMTSANITLHREVMVEQAIAHLRVVAPEAEMARYDLLALPVVDEEGHLIGIITHDDLVDVLENEATTVRGLALGELEPRDGLRAMGKEVLIGLANGVAIGCLVALIALWWKGTPMLGVVVGLATPLNLIGAGIAGALVPLVMQVLRVDPALGSPILVTTITDTSGYFVYLGLATLILTRLI